MKNFQEQIKQFFAKTDKEILEYLLQWWEMDSASENGTIRLIGTYEKAEKPDKNGNEYGFFINVRSCIFRSIPTHFQIRFYSFQINSWGARSTFFVSVLG